MNRIILPFSLILILFLTVTSVNPRRTTLAMQQAMPQTQGCDLEPQVDYTQSISGLVEGDPLEIRVSARFAGAIDSLTWRGKEFINIADHGRQISYAWFLDDYGECLNPTEPGTLNDGRGLTSSSRLLSVCRNSENSLTTTTQLAYWTAPGQPCNGRIAVNDTILSDDILEKTVEIGYQGIDNVIAFTAIVTVPENHHSINLQIPTGYLTYEFDNYWLYNPQTGKLIKPESQPIPNVSINIWSFVLRGLNIPPILATRDEAYAMGAYTDEANSSYEIFAHTIPPTLGDRTHDWSISVREQPYLEGSHQYRSFAIVGTLEQVQEAMRALYALHPTDIYPPDYNPPSGSVDVATCQEVAGWAADPKTPNQPIFIAIYEVAEDGTETLLIRSIADRPRPDVGTYLGDDGLHGYSIETASFLHDGLRHKLQVRAINSDSRLLDPALPLSLGVTTEIECPELQPEPTPADTPPVKPSSTTAAQAGPEGKSESTPADTPFVKPTSTTAAQAGPEGKPGSGWLPCLGGTMPLALGAALWLKRLRR